MITIKRIKLLLLMCAIFYGGMLNYLYGEEVEESSFKQQFHGSIMVSNWYFQRTPKDNTQPNDISSFFARGDYSAEYGKFNTRINLHMNYDHVNYEMQRYFVDDAYISWFNNYIETRAGYQIVSWKVVESISQADIINQQNYERDIFSPTKMGELCAQGKIFMDNQILEVYYLPIFQQTYLPQQGNRYDLFAGKDPKMLIVNKNVQYDLSQGKTRPQGALRYRVGSENLDGSFFYFNGYRRFPLLIPVSENNSTIPLYHKYAQIHTAGITFQRNLLDFSVRGELVYNRFQNSIYSTSGKKVDPYFAYTTGVQKTVSLNNIESGDIDMFFELIGDSDYKKEQEDLEGPRLYQSNISIGIGYNFNNSTERSISATSLIDYIGHDVYCQLIYSEKAFKTIKYKVALDGLINQKSNKLSSLSNAQRAKFEIEYSF